MGVRAVRISNQMRVLQEVVGQRGRAGAHGAIGEFAGSPCTGQGAARGVATLLGAVGRGELRVPVST